MSTQSDALKKWQEHCQAVQKFTSSAVVVNETPTQKSARIARARKDYSFFCSYYFAHYCKCKNGKFQNDAAKYILENKDMQAVFMWPRAHAKSTHFGIMIPLWLKFQAVPELHVMVTVGKSEDSAQTLLSDLQAELQFNQLLISDFGQQFNSGSWEEGEFVTLDDTAFFARGRGQSPRGLRHRDQRPDYINIDDLDDDELVKNERRVNQMTDWLKEALFGSLDGGHGRFMMIGNLISKCSVLANISKIKTVHLSRINALDKNGEPVWKEKFTKEDLQKEADFMGYRAFQKEKMNNPITEGAVFKNDWIRWKKPLKWNQYDDIVAYCDPSFKGTGKNDYKAIKVWGKKGSELHLLKAFVRQSSLSEMVRWWYDFHESLPEDVVCRHYMEANFMQDIILDEFAQEGNVRGYQLPLSPDKRKKPEKFQRIEAISPLWERGFTFYNADLQADKDMLTGLEQTLAFEKGTNAHDDGPDADEGAIYMLQKRTREEAFTPSFGRRSSARNSW